MRKRLRKKKRLGEFVEYGVCLWARLKSWQNSDEDFDFFEKFTDFLCPMDLYCGGGLGETWDLFITAKGRNSVTEKHVEKIKEWLTNQPEVIDLNFSELVDAWHGDFLKYNEIEHKWKVKKW